MDEEAKMPDDPPTEGRKVKDSFRTGSTPSLDPPSYTQLSSKLERKDSCGDLQSRLKTRKILGVGETDNGDIHRSKISQVLGHNDHLYLQLPRGYWKWQLLLGISFGIQAVFIILFPGTASEIHLLGASADHTSTANHYYALSLMALGFLHWKFLKMNDKGIVRAIQTMSLFYFGSLLLADILYGITHGFTVFYDKWMIANMGIRLLAFTICYAYIKRIGKAMSGVRKGNKDLYYIRRD